MSMARSSKIYTYSYIFIHKYCDNDTVSHSNDKVLKLSCIERNGEPKQRASSVDALQVKVMRTLVSPELM